MFHNVPKVKKGPQLLPFCYNTSKMWFGIILLDYASPAIKKTSIYLCFSNTCMYHSAIIVRTPIQSWMLGFKQRWLRHFWIWFAFGIAWCWQTMVLELFVKNVSGCFFSIFLAFYNFSRHCDFGTSHKSYSQALGEFGGQLISLYHVSQVFPEWRFVVWGDPMLLGRIWLANGWFCLYCFICLSGIKHTDWLF